MFRLLGRIKKVQNDLPPTEIAKSAASVGKNICKIEAKSKIQRQVPRPAPHELNT